MREFLGNEQAAYAVYEHMEAVVGFIEGLLAALEGGALGAQAQP